jgi:hypothetical protein
MFPLVELPKIVEHYTPYFVSVLSREAFIQFERYIKCRTKFRQTKWPHRA